jgi:asparagine synthetase B (glutamine-hydrolysing)
MSLLESGVGAEIDFEALSVFLRLGFFLGDDTPFKRIRVLPPAGRLAWRRGHLVVAGGRPEPAPRNSTTGTAVDDYIDLFRSAISRRLPMGRSAVPLSGGLDSRHIVLELVRQGQPPDFVATVGAPTGRMGNEVHCAAEVARTLGLRHVLLRSSQRRLRDEEEKNAVTHFCADSHTWLLALRDALLAEAVECAYDGIAGDVLSNGVFLDANRHALYDAGRLHELADLLLGRNEEWMRQLLPEDVYQEMDRTSAIERVVRELRTHDRAASPVTAFHFWNRTRRTAALSPYGVLRDIRVMYCPFLDHDLFDFLMSLPAELLMTHSFHEATVSRAYPELARSAYAPKGSGKELLGSLKASGAELAAHLSSRRCGLVRTSHVLPRLALGLLGLRSLDWWYFRAAYLRQLERVRDGLAGGTRSTSRPEQ